MTIKLEKNVLHLLGRVNFNNVVALTETGIEYFQHLDSITVDLQALEQDDSSGLALISAWIRRAKELKKEIIFINMPIFLRDLARVNGIEVLIPMR